MGRYGILIIAAIIVIVVFFITREFWCWYWKINERISLMDKQNELFKLIIKSQNIKIPEELNDKLNDLKTFSANGTQKNVMIVVKW